MNTKLFTSVFVLAAVSGSMVLFTGCQPEGEPMPPGVYIQPVEKDPEKVDVPKQDAGNPSAPPAVTEPAFEPAPAPEVKEVPAKEEVAAAEKKEDKSLKDASVKKTDKKAEKKAEENKKAEKKTAPRKVAERKEVTKYVVKKNDNLSRIAYTYGLKVSELKTYNNLKKDVIYPSQVLLIPPTGMKVTAASPDLANNKKAEKKAVKANPLPADGFHKVKARENFTTIARFYGIRVADIVAANPGVNSAKLRIGQKLKIVAGAGKEAEKEVVAPVVKQEGAKKAAPAPAVKKDDDKTLLSDEDLFKDIKSPDEVSEKAETPAAGDKTPAAEKAKETDMNDLPGADESSEKIDKVVNTPDGKTKIILVKATTLENFATRYGVSVESLRKSNSNLPASGELKAGTEITFD
ncbi:MAG: LysM peptidoglycan-binding domain-containing protein [Lentisphaeria bacterium]|nr:LysM peptidoglycan-binding domain-containing protein [Lentisphaeria bacterium]